jgi:hypothetical protein
MKLSVTLSLILLAPAAAGAQGALVRSPARLGAAVAFPTESRSPANLAPPVTVDDSTRSSFTRNIIRGAIVGGVIGGVFGAIASEHQAVEPGFAHTPAALFVVTYGGLGVLLGLIAGTMLPGS